MNTNDKKIIIILNVHISRGENEFQPLMNMGNILNIYLANVYIEFMGSKEIHFWYKIGGRKNSNFSYDIYFV